MTNAPLGILGGTFDPIHLGHLHIAYYVLQETPVKKIGFVPSYQPVHRSSPLASADDRTKMIKLAIKNTPEFYVDTREIERETPSFMIDTLMSLRKDFPQTPLVLILGMDAYLNLPAWKDWQDLLNYAHIVVVNRPSIELSSHPNAWLKKHEQSNPHVLTEKLAGNVLLIETPPSSITATEIRKRIRDQKSILEWVPESVARYIDQHHLYQ